MDYRIGHRCFIHDAVDGVMNMGLRIVPQAAGRPDGVVMV